MKIPTKYQVFDVPVTLSSKDEERLAPSLVGWMHLAAILTDINEPDLMRLVVMELLGKQRRKIIDRLLGRISRVQRKRIEERIAKCLPKRKSKKSRKQKSKRSS